MRMRKTRISYYPSHPSRKNDATRRTHNTERSSLVVAGRERGDALHSPDMTTRGIKRSPHFRDQIELSSRMSDPAWVSLETSPTRKRRGFRFSSLARESVLGVMDHASLRSAGILHDLHQ